MSKYKICLFYGNDKIVEQEQRFAHHEEALRWIVWKRTELTGIFGAVVYRRQQYLDYFLVHESWKIFKFVAHIERCVVAIEGSPPLISYIDDFKNNTGDLLFSDRLGFQLKDMKMVLVYTGNLSRRCAISYILHEIGHCEFDLRSSLPYDSYMLRHELEAWEFAVDNANIAGVPEDYVRMTAKECIESYLEDYDLRSICGTGMPKKRWWTRYRKLVKQKRKLIK